MTPPVRASAVEAATDMIDFVGRRKYFAAISLALLTPCLIALAIWQFNPGIDFVGGLEIETRLFREVPPAQVEEIAARAGLEDLAVEAGDDGAFLITGSASDSDQSANAAADAANTVQADLESEIGQLVSEDVITSGRDVEISLWFLTDVTQDDIRNALETVDLGDARIQATGESSFQIRAQEPAAGTLEDLRQEIVAALRDEVGAIFVLRSDAVSEVLSAEIARDAGIALAVASVAILIYITLAFRKLPNPAVYGAAAIIALMHDVTIVTGVFAILGEVADIQVNTMFVTGLLAIIGYSVNDTIVVFDRIREHLLLDPSSGMRSMVNAAITQTLPRSLNTSITLVLALLALLLVGGVTVRPFVIVLLTGAVAGTYSSIAVAAQVVVLWEEGAFHRLLRQPHTPQRRRVSA